MILQRIQPRPLLVIADPVASSLVRPNDGSRGVVAQERMMVSFSLRRRWDSMDYDCISMPHVLDVPAGHCAVNDVYRRKERKCPTVDLLNRYLSYHIVCGK